MTRGTRAPFFPMDPLAWVEVVEDLPRPWSKRVALADLEWWENEVRRGAQARVPGRRTLAKTGGWADRAARTLLDSRERPASVPPASRSSAVSHRKDYSERTASVPPPARSSIRGKTKQQDNKNKPPSSPPVPSWVPPANQLKPTTRAEALALVLQAIEAITTRTPKPTRAASSARPILALWRGEGRPPLPELVEDLLLVARWAKESPDPQAARDIRAEGWEGGTNRSRAPAAICRRSPPPSSSGATWDERLQLAAEWRDRGFPAQSDTPTTAPTLTPQQAMLAELDRMDEEARLKAEAAKVIELHPNRAQGATQ